MQLPLSLYGIGLKNVYHDVLVAEVMLVRALVLLLTSTLTPVPATTTPTHPTTHCRHASVMERRRHRRRQHPLDPSPLTGTWTLLQPVTPPSHRHQVWHHHPWRTDLRSAAPTLASPLWQQHPCWHPGLPLPRLRQAERTTGSPSTTTAIAVVCHPFTCVDGAAPLAGTADGHRHQAWHHHPWRTNLRFTTLMLAPPL